MTTQPKIFLLDDDRAPWANLQVVEAADLSMKAFDAIVERLDAEIKEEEDILVAFETHEVDDVCGDTTIGVDECADPSSLLILAGIRGSYLRAMSLTDAAARIVAEAIDNSRPDDLLEEARRSRARSSVRASHCSL
jgi:hypothetical protein